MGRRRRVLAGAAIGASPTRPRLRRWCGRVGYTTAQWTSGVLLLADAWVPWAAVGQIALCDSLRAGNRRWLMGVVKATLPTAFAFLLGEMFLAVIGVCFGLAMANVVEVSERRARQASRSPRAAGLGRLRWHSFSRRSGLDCGATGTRRHGVDRGAAPLSKADAEIVRCTRCASSSSWRPGAWAMLTASILPLAGLANRASTGCRSPTACTWRQCNCPGTGRVRRRQRLVVALGAIAGTALLIAMAATSRYTGYSVICFAPGVHASAREVRSGFGGWFGLAGGAGRGSHLVAGRTTLAPDRDPSGIDRRLRDCLALRLPVPLVRVHGARPAPRGRGRARCARGPGPGAAGRAWRPGCS